MVTEEPGYLAAWLREEVEDHEKIHNILHWGCYSRDDVLNEQIPLR